MIFYTFSSEDLRRVTSSNHPLNLGSVDSALSLEVVQY